MSIVRRTLRFLCTSPLPFRLMWTSYVYALWVPAAPCNVRAIRGIYSFADCPPDPDAVWPAAGQQPVHIPATPSRSGGRTAIR